MTQENENKENEENEDVKITPSTPEVIEEKEEKEVVEEKEELIDDSIFITEADTFEISLKYYVENKNNIKKHYVETLDDYSITINEIKGMKEPDKILSILKGRAINDLLDEEQEELQKEMLKQGFSIFDNKNKNVKTLKAKFKYPSQGDHELILSSFGNSGKQETTINDIVMLETTRLVVLLRDWNIDADTTRVLELDSKIVKGLINKLREVLGIQSLF